MQLLCNLSELHPYAEVFQDIAAGDYTGDLRLKPPLAYIDILKKHKAGRLSAVNEYFVQLARETTGRPAFKVMYDQLRRRPEIFLGAIRHRYAFVHLVRQNYIDIVVSKAIAEESRVFHTAEQVDLPVVTIPPASFVRQVRNIDLQVRFFSSLLQILPGSCLTLTYEDLVRDPIGELRRVAKFVKATVPLEIDVSRDWRKGVTHSPEKMLKNFDEIRYALEASRFRHMVRSNGVISKG